MGIRGVLMVSAVSMIAGGVIVWCLFGKPTGTVALPNSNGAFISEMQPPAHSPVFAANARKSATRILDSLNIRDSVRYIDSVRIVDSIVSREPVTPVPDKSTNPLIEAIARLSRDTSLIPTSIMPAFTQQSPTWSAGFIFGHDFLGGGYAGGFLTRLEAGDFTIFGEVGFWRTSFMTLLSLAYTPWAIIH